MDRAAASQADREALKEKVRELASLSRDLENLTRQMGAAQSTIQVGFLQERVDQLSGTQRKLITEIAAACPDAEMQTRFESLDKRLEQVRRQVKESRDAVELETLKAEIDPLVEEWAELFQQMVIATINPPA